MIFNGARLVCFHVFCYFSSFYIEKSYLLTKKRRQPRKQTHGYFVNFVGGRRDIRWTFVGHLVLTFVGHLLDIRWHLFWHSLDIYWWSVGIFGITCRSSEGNQRSNRFRMSVLLCQGPKPNISMISGCLDPWGTFIYGFK